MQDETTIERSRRAWTNSMSSQPGPLPVESLRSLAARRTAYLRLAAGLGEEMRGLCAAEVASGRRKGDVARDAGVSRVTLDAWLGRAKRESNGSEER